MVWGLRMALLSCMRDMRRYSCAYIVIALSIAVNVVLFAIKYAVGLTVASVAMQADAWHTLSDTFTSVVLLLGFWIAMRPPDPEHPFGHGRIEPIVALIIGILLAIVGFNFLQESLLRLQDTTVTVYSDVSLAIFGVSVLVKEAMAQFAIRMGRNMGSDAIRADGWHHRSDALSTIIIVGGALMGQHYWWIDGLLGILVSLFIFYASYAIFYEVTNLLIGEQPSEHLRRRIIATITKVSPEAQQVHHLHLHRYGNHIELTLHLYLPSDMSLLEAHAIADQIETALRDELAIETTVHMDPLKPPSNRHTTEEQKGETDLR